MIETLKQAKDVLKEGYEKGVACPCCDQHVKMYRRKLTSSMAWVLIMMYRDDLTEFSHIEDYLKKKDIPSGVRGDFPKLRYWVLIEKEEVKREDGSSRNGNYRLTDKGIQFVKGLIKVPKYVKIYNSKSRGYAGDDININDALGEKFNYNELMLNL